MAAKGKPTKSFMKHLEHREGNVSKSYLDSVGKLTGGIGHLLLEDDIKKQKVHSVQGTIGMLK